MSLLLRHVMLVLYLFVALVFLVGFAAGYACAQERSPWPRGALCVAGDDLDGRGPSGNWNDGHGAGHDWYSRLRDYRGVSCCNGDPDHGDCRPVRARQATDGSWSAWFDGDWHIVPPQAVLDPRLNRSPLQAHICANRDTGYIYCFLAAGAGS